MAFVRSDPLDDDLNNAFQAPFRRRNPVDDPNSKLPNSAEPDVALPALIDANPSAAGALARTDYESCEVNGRGMTQLEILESPQCLRFPWCGWSERPRCSDETLERRWKEVHRHRTGGPES